MPSHPMKEAGALLAVAVVAALAVVARKAEESDVVNTVDPTDPGFTVPNDLDPDTKSVWQTAPLGPDGVPQIQTVATGTMTAIGEETTLEERGDRRQMFALSQTPQTITSDVPIVRDSDPTLTEDNTIIGGGL